MKKQITLPIGNLEIFKTLAEGYAESTDSPKSMIPKYVQSMAKESYLKSFSADHSDLSSNPHTPRVAPSFYDSFPEIFDSERGWFAKVSDNFSLAKEKIRRYKTAVIGLTQLYLEVGGLKTKAGKGIFTDFDYPVNEGRDATEADYAKLVKVEKARYVRLFAATMFTKAVWKFLQIPAKEIEKIIVNNNLWNLDESKPFREQFLVLKNSKNRAQFVKDVKENINI